MNHVGRTALPVALTAVLCACGSMPAALSTATPSVSTSSALQPTATPCSATGVLAGWPLQRLAEQTIVVPVDGSDPEAVLPEVAAGAGGVILFGSSAPADLAAELQALTAAAPQGLAPFVMTDEEGGAVQRMANLAGALPSARDMAATMTPAQIQQLAASAALRMRAAGVTMDLAPVLDLDGGDGPNNADPDGTRSFSIDPSIATPDALAFAAGLMQGGVIPVVKHFPGLGQASGNTDVTPATTLPWNQLQSRGLLPFAAAVQDALPAVMVANASVPGLTDQPASISSAAIAGVLRQQLGFTGLVMTDSLSATALAKIGYDVTHAVVAALTAGADLTLFSADAQHVQSETAASAAAIVSAAETGQLSRSRLVDAVVHILAAKHVDPCAAA
ncbi:MAG: glycoside hydrolase family 3 protein [Candidatus Dormibacteraeota bacterium]|nr:glycoside hydrolase family 3 protein [Candidatus Dormibacteraeota bacterium]